jgi:transposase
MRGHDEQQEGMFSYLSPEKRVPQDHPLRVLRRMVDVALKEMSPQFAGLYSRYGRPSIAPEKLLRALLLQVFYSVRSERLLMEQLGYNLLFRWFVGLSMDDEVWDVTVFTKNRERLLAGEIADEFFEQIVKQARAAGLLSDEHFTVDGTLIEAWANRRSFHPKDDPPAKGTGARGRKLLRDTHESSTDPESRLFKKSAAGQAKPSYLGHLMTENRNGLVVGARVSESGTRGEREAALAMLQELLAARKKDGEGAEQEKKAMTLGADKSYQEEKFLNGLRQLGVIPHVSEYEKETVQWPNRLTREEREHPGFASSQKKRKLVEKVFGWLKSVAALRQTKFRGRRRVDWMFRLAAAAYNLVRMRKLIPAVRWGHR